MEKLIVSENQEGIKLIGVLTLPNNICKVATKEYLYILLQIDGGTCSLWKARACQPFGAKRRMLERVSLF